MKQRPEPLPERDAEASFKALARALAALDRPQDVRAFLQDLCTPAELEAMADRWRVVPLLLEGVPYREIHERTAGQRHHHRARGAHAGTRRRRLRRRHAAPASRASSASH